MGGAAVCAFAILLLALPAPAGSADPDEVLLIPVPGTGDLSAEVIPAPQDIKVLSRITIREGDSLWRIARRTFLIGTGPGADVLAHDPAIDLGTDRLVAEVDAVQGRAHRVVAVFAGGDARSPSRARISTFGKDGENRLSTARRLIASRAEGLTARSSPAGERTRFGGGPPEEAEGPDGEGPPEGRRGEGGGANDRGIGEQTRLRRRDRRSRSLSGPPSPLVAPGDRPLAPGRMLSVDASLRSLK